MGVVIRQIVGRAELEQCYDLWDTAFVVGRPYFQMRLDHDREYREETTWGAFVEGRLASAIQIFPYWAQYGTAAVHVAGMGNVATHPEFRHRGLAQMVLRQQILWMERTGFDLSLLFTGIPPFYQQVGWHAFTSPGSYALDPEHRPPANHDYGVRVLHDDGDDWSGIADVYASFRPHLPMTRVRSAEYWQDWKNWSQSRHPTIWVAERGGIMAGYMITMPAQEGESDRVVECLYRPGEESAAWALIAGFREAQGSGALSLWLPSGHALTEGSRHGERGGGAMWRTFDPVRLFDRITPELSRRWRASEGPDVRVTLALCVDELPVFRLQCGPGEVVLLPASEGHISYDEGCRFSRRDLLAMVLTGELPDLSPVATAALSRLFPPADPFLWEIDHF